MNDAHAVPVLILAAALVTYATRVGGHLVLARLPRVPRRLAAALDAVPVAVLTALVAPALLAQGAVESAALLLAGLVALRFQPVWTVATAVAAVVVLRGVS